MIAVAGVDMAIWDALAKAAGLPLAALLSGTAGQVPAYNSNGLWLVDVSALSKEAEQLVAEGGFKALKLRLGRDHLGDDLAANHPRQHGAWPDRRGRGNPSGARRRMDCRRGARRRRGGAGQTARLA